MVAIPCTNVTPEALRREFGALPIVMADRIGEDSLPVDTVTVDKFAAGQEAARHLLSVGHDAIAIAASVSQLRPIRDRIDGVADAWRLAGAPPPRVVDVGVDPERGGEILDAWLGENPLPSAIVAMTNVTTLATLSALAARKLDIPDDVSVVSFDDYPWMTARKVPLSAVRQPISDMAEAIWSSLVSRMDGSRDAPQKIVLQAPLQARSSVAAPRVARPGREVAQ